MQTSKKKNVSEEQAEVEEEGEEYRVDVDEEEEANLHHEEKRMIGFLTKKNKKKNCIRKINFHISIM